MNKSRCRQHCRHPRTSPDHPDPPQNTPPRPARRRFRGHSESAKLARLVSGWGGRSHGFLAQALPGTATAPTSWTAPILAVAVPGNAPLPPSEARTTRYCTTALWPRRLAIAPARRGVMPFGRPRKQRFGKLPPRLRRGRPPIQRSLRKSQDSRHHFVERREQVQDLEARSQRTFERFQERRPRAGGWGVGYLALRSLGNGRLFPLSRWG